MNTDPLPQAARLGPTFQGWECTRCGVVDASEVVDLPDEGPVHAGGYVPCWAVCHPVEILINDPRRWANDGILRLQALATEVLRLREALALIAHTQTTPRGYRQMAQRALRGEPLDSGHPSDRC
ncbi:MAG: hypothetical protein OWQ57_13360 [Sulfobacillus sp.]|nr:hypothetical protein [Sulfobacillus sp.]